MLTLKLKYKCLDINYFIMAYKAIYYKCQVIFIEDLNMKSSDKDKGKIYNALCNNYWLRTTFCNQLRKRTNIYI